MQYIQPSRIDTPAQGALNSARSQKARVWEEIKLSRDRLRSEPINGNRTRLRLNLFYLNDQHNKAMQAEREALKQIEQRANELELTTIKGKI